jgi:hypothetical protein
MQLDSRVKVIALSFLSVLVDTRLRRRLREGMEEGRCRLLRGTAPVMQGFILNVPRGVGHPKVKTSVPCNKWTNASHRPVKQQLPFRAGIWGCYGDVVSCPAVWGQPDVSELAQLAARFCYNPEDSILHFCWCLQCNVVIKSKRCRDHQRLVENS